jgi:hypothetical protein
VSEYVTVEQAARLLGLTLTDTARLIVSGELAVSVPAGVPLDDVSIRVVGSRLRALLDDREAFRFSTVDRSEANRIFGRKYSLRGWPPVEWSPGSGVSGSVGHDDILNVVDNPSIIIEWLDKNGQYDSRISDMVDGLCGARGQMSRREFDVALAELERPKVARLRMWFDNALRAGRRPSIAEVRARVEE